MAGWEMRACPKAPPDGCAVEPPRLTEESITSHHHVPLAPGAGRCCVQGALSYGDAVE